MPYCDRRYVLRCLYMPHSCPALPLILRTTYGTHLPDRLGLAEVAVAALLEVDADLIGV